MDKRPSTKFARSLLSRRRRNKNKNNILTVKSSDKYQDIGYKTLQAFDWVNLI